MYYGDHTMASRNPSPGDKIREYEIVETIGKGGMATVYKARHTLIDQVVAIKIMKPSLTDDPQFCERFVREAQAQAKLIGHPNIVTIHNLFEENNLYVIVMEYIDGLEVDSKKFRTLAQYIEQTGVLTIKQFSPILSGVLNGLSFAHEQHIIHRDIKPANIMLTKTSTAKIVDFGIARVVADQRLTKTGIAVGTPKYMSPEQVRSEKVDARSDIYSLGIAMYEALTGKVPFKGDTDYEIMRQHEEKVPSSPRSINPGITKQWEELTLMCIAKDPQHRPQQVNDIKNMLLGQKKAKRPPVKHVIKEYKPSTKDPLKSFSKRKTISLLPRIIGAAIVMIMLTVLYYVAIYLPGRKKQETMLIPDSISTATVSNNIILVKYLNIGNLIKHSSYVMTAFILCNEDNLNEIIIQLIQDEPDMVYSHFTDNENKVVASSNAGAIGAVYKSDFLSSRENTVLEKDGFYEGAFTINVEGNALGAFYFSARQRSDENAQPLSDRIVQRYSSIGNLIAHFPNVEDALIQKDKAQLAEVIASIKDEIPEIEYVYIYDYVNEIVASSDTLLIGKVYSHDLVHTNQNTLEPNEDMFNGTFSISVGDKQVGTLLFGARY